MAAVTSGAKDIIERPYIHVTDNAIMNSLLLQSAFENNVSHFIFPSCTVMYQSSNRPLKETDFDANKGLVSHYFGVGWTKVYIEKMCEFFSRLGKTKYTVFRHSNVFGPYDKFDLEKSHVFGATLTKIMTLEEKIVVWGDGTEKRDLIYVEDLIYREKPLRVTGAVINWTANLLSGLHMDPLMIPSKAVVDATGHDAELLRIAQERIPNFPFKVKGHRGMYAYEGEKLVVEKSGEVILGLYVTGMATASLYGLPRMGPIFSSMLLSGKKVADEIIRKLK